MKLKLFLKRCVAPFLCIAFLCCAFVVPVGAAGSGWNSFTVSFRELFSHDDSLYYHADNTTTTISPAWKSDYQIGWNLPSLSSSVAYDFENYHSFNVSAGDVINLDFPMLRLKFSNRASNVYASGSVRVRVLYFIRSQSGSDSNQTVVAFDETRQLNSQGQFSGKLLASAKSTITGEFVRFRVYIDLLSVSLSASDPQLRVTYDENLNISYGNPTAAEAPNYSSPDEGDLGALEDKEQELESNTAEGREEVQEIISPESLTSTLLSYANGLQFTSRIMLSAITKIPFLNALIWVAMSLGFVASLLGLAGAIIAASDRRAGATARAGKHSRR